MSVRSFCRLVAASIRNHKANTAADGDVRVDFWGNPAISTTHFHTRALIVVAAVCLLVPAPSAAREPSLSPAGAAPAVGAQAVATRGLDGDQPLSFAVIDQDLRAFLAEFGRMQGLSVRLSDAVQGRVRGRLPQLPPRALLDRLAAMHGFDWFLDGAVLHVSAGHEAGSRMLPLKGVSFARLVATLDGLGLADPRWPLRHASSANLVVVAGPPALVAQVELALATLNDAARAEVRVARGRTGG